VAFFIPSPEPSPKTTIPAAQGGSLFVLRILVKINHFQAENG
jgi:hypothetical protein